MIKRSFFAMSGPTLSYDIVESDLKEPTNIPIPPKLILLVNEPPNPAKKALIKAKKKVIKGQKLSLYDGSAEYAVSPVSGTIKAVETYSDQHGNLSTYITIADEKDEAAKPKKAKKVPKKESEDSEKPPEKPSEKTDDSKKPAPSEDSSEKPAEPKEPEEISYELEESLASAAEFLNTLPGVPPLRQLADSGKKIDTIVVSGIDTDLLATTRQYVTLKYFNEVKKGAFLLQKMTQAANLYLAIPENISLTEMTEPLQVIKISTKYPSGLPASILKDRLGITPAQGESPEDAGVCFVSAEAAASLARAYETKKAVLEKILTVIGKDGKAHRVKAVIGTPLSRIFKALNIRLEDHDRLVIGGPMTGFAGYSVHHPVAPDMDTVIVQDKNQISEVSDNACVNCGKCIRICPADVPVNMLVRNLEIGQYEEAADFYDLLSCIECGLCAYVCTAHIPIFQYIMLGKNKLLKLKEDD